MTINSELDASKIVAVLANITSPEIERACSILYCRKGKHETPVPVITPDKQNGVNKQEKRVCGGWFPFKSNGQRAPLITYHYNTGNPTEWVFVYF